MEFHAPLKGFLHTHVSLQLCPIKTYQTSDNLQIEKGVIQVIFRYTNKWESKHTQNEEQCHFVSLNLAMTTIYALDHNDPGGWWPDASGVSLILTLGEPSLWMPTSLVAMPLTLPSSWNSSYTHTDNNTHQPSDTHTHIYTPWCVAQSNVCRIHVQQPLVWHHTNTHILNDTNTERWQTILAM